MDVSISVWPIVTGGVKLTFGGVVVIGESGQILSGVEVRLTIGAIRTLWCLGGWILGYCDWHGEQITVPRRYLCTTELCHKWSHTDRVPSGAKEFSSLTRNKRKSWVASDLRVTGNYLGWPTLTPKLLSIVQYSSEQKYRTNVTRCKFR